MRLDGKKLKVTITTGGLLDGAPHAMHLHGGKRGLCPPSSVAGPHNGHISIATHAGVPYYGPVAQSLTTKGDVSPKSFLRLPRYPNTGAIHYTRSIKGSAASSPPRSASTTPSLSSTASTTTPTACTTARWTAASSTAA